MEHSVSFVTKSNDELLEMFEANAQSRVMRGMAHLDCRKPRPKDCEDDGDFIMACTCYDAKEYKQLMFSRNLMALEIRRRMT